jgi:hypothetical protein
MTVPEHDEELLLVASDDERQDEPETHLLSIQDSQGPEEAWERLSAPPDPAVVQQLRKKRGCTCTCEDLQRVLDDLGDAYDQVASLKRARTELEAKNTELEAKNAALVKDRLDLVARLEAWATQATTIVKMHVQSVQVFNASIAKLKDSPS